VTQLAARWNTAMRVTYITLPQGPSLRSGSIVPVHQHLSGPIRPTGRHSAISPLCGLYALPSLYGSASATDWWFRAFTARSVSTCHPPRTRGVAGCTRPARAGAGRELLHASAQSQDLLSELRLSELRHIQTTTKVGVARSHPRAVERGTPRSAATVASPVPWTRCRRLWS
jgi:hypothetical protein